MEATTETKAPQFQHEPFGDDRNQIRLVQILPHLSNDGLVQLSMKNYWTRSRQTLDGTDKPRTAPVYSCLSYTWGDEPETHTISINGLPYRVRRNLWNFLVAVRKQYVEHGGLRHHNKLHGGIGDTYLLCLSSDLFFWIDALCIDQSNDAEKGHQVQRMGAIYKKAQLVLIWLSLIDRDDSVLQRMHRVGSSYIMDMPNDPLLKELLAKDYWSRAWITQEVLQAREPVFFIHSGLYDYFTIANRLMPSFHFENHNFTNLYYLYRESTATNTYSTFQDHGHASRVGLPTMLWKLSEKGYRKQCANVLDRVYSILSLCLDGFKVQVDYSLNPAELAANVLMTYKESFCVCFLKVVVETLQLDRHVHKILDSLHVTIRVPTSSADSNPNITGGGLRCYACELSRGLWDMDHTVLCFARNICKSIYGHLIAVQPEDPCKPCRILHLCEQDGEIRCSEREILGASVSYESANHSKWRLSMSSLLSVFSLEKQPFRNDLCDRARLGSFNGPEPGREKLELNHG